MRMPEPALIILISELWASLQCLALVLTPWAICRAWSTFKSIRAGHWPLAEGTIESGGVSVRYALGGTRFDFLHRYERATATLNYSFKVDGEYCSGCFNQSFADEQRAWDFVDAMKGQQVQVRYHPTKPERSMIRAQDQIVL